MKELKTQQIQPAKDIIWLICLLFIAVLLAVFVRSHIIKTAGGFERDLYFPFSNTNQLVIANPATPNLFRENGRYLYTTVCAPCHQTDGSGIAGQYPPLVGSEWVQANGSGRLIRVLLNGMQGEVEVAGAKYNNTMLPWKDLLSDSQIAAILTFIRSEWGNKSGDVSAENVKTIRDKESTRTEPWTAEELLQIQEFE